MTIKKATRAPKLPRVDQIHDALRNGDGFLAIYYAQKLHDHAATPTNLTTLKQTFIAVATQFIDANKFKEFNRLMVDAAAIDPDDPLWKVERAYLLSRGGQTSEALQLIQGTTDLAVRMRVLSYAVDRAIRRQSREHLPKELHADYETVLAAFKHYEAGNDPAARELLDTIGLRSVFLEWKILLRGLLAYSAGDNTRAAENFARLDIQRLPARLVQPLRMEIDPAFKATLNAADQATLHTRLRTLTASPIVTSLRTIIRDLGRDNPLKPVFRTIETLLPQLRTTLPDLIPRLADCIYRLVYQLGGPDDLPRYRRLFGSPKHDPDFLKLQANALTEVGEHARAFDAWQKFELWLATRTHEWPPETLARARAEIWSRMGELALLKEKKDAVLEDAAHFFNYRIPEKKKNSRDKSAEDCFRRTIELAPNWSESVRKLYRTLNEKGRGEEAEHVIRDYLTRQPHDRDVLLILARHLMKSGRIADAANVWLKLVEINPLDRTNNHHASKALQVAARQALVANAPAEAEAILLQHERLLVENTRTEFHALRHVLAVKKGQSEQAAEHANRAMNTPGSRVSAAYFILADSILAKLKPVDKKHAEARFEAEYAKLPTPREVLQLIEATDLYLYVGITYRGQKAHATKALNLSDKCLSAQHSEIDFEYLNHTLVQRNATKHAKKMLSFCRNQFKLNPAFIVFEVMMRVIKKPGDYQTRALLVHARHLAECATEPRHQAQLEIITEMERTINKPNQLLPDFFPHL